MEQDKYEHARQNAKAWAEKLIAMHTTRLELEEHPGADELNYENLEDQAREMPLSVMVRSPWYEPGSEPPKPAEFEILLSTGGPALRVRGELGRFVACRAHLEMQDWGVPWREAYGMDIDYAKLDAALLWFAGLFYFGE